jgi:hypothetical protein
MIPRRRAMKTISNNGLSPTMVLRFLNSQLGSSVQTLELSSKEMMRIVYQQSIPTFSKYFPFLPICQLEDKDRINGSSTEFRIPNPWNLQILSLHKYYVGAEQRFAGGWLAPMVGNPIDSALLSDRISMFTTPLILEYWPPNRIVIKQNYYNLYGQLSVQFKAVHPTHMKTIEPNMRDDFLHLCLYDVLISLYPMRHRFQTISTTYGSLEPFFEMVDGAEQKRSELLENWQKNYISAGEQKKIWIM